MISTSGEGSVRLVYLLTGGFALAGFSLLWPAEGFRFALAFLLGGIASVGNLYLFGYLTRSISPAGGEKKPWQAGMFVSRYILMFAGGYVIFKTLGVNPLAILLGLLASSAAVVASIIIELFERLINGT